MIPGHLYGARGNEQEEEVEVPQEQVVVNRSAFLTEDDENEELEEDKDEDEDQKEDQDEQEAFEENEENLPQGPLSEEEAEKFIVDSIAMYFKGRNEMIQGVTRIAMYIKDNYDHKEWTNMMTFVCATAKDLLHTEEARKNPKIKSNETIDPRQLKINENSRVNRKMNKFKKDLENILFKGKQVRLCLTSQTADDLT
jgi:hypothetical protein